MKLVPAVIERAKDGTYSVYCENECFSGMGNTLEAAKADMQEQISLFKKAAQEEKLAYPSFLDEPYEFTYRWNVKSLLSLYSDASTLSGLGKRAKINPKQLWSYMHGKSIPRRTQLDKLENAIHEIGKELLSIRL